MAERTEPKITRTDVIVVDSVGSNDYGDLTWIDKAGKEYKVSNKRIKYFEKVILPEMAVQLTYAEAYGKEYIHKAELVSNLIAGTTPQPPQPKIEASKPVAQQEVSKAKPMPSKDDSLIRVKGISLSYSKDLAMEKVITPEQILSYAEVFYRYQIGEIEVKDEAVFKSLIEKHFKNKE